MARNLSPWPPLRLTASVAVVAAATLTAVVARPLFDAVSTGPPVDHRGISRGAAWGDYDGDGDPDLFVTRPTWDGPVQRNTLYRNDGEGRFVRADPPAGTGKPGGWEGAAWIDVEGDGDLDLHVVGRNGAGSLLLENVGAGHLRPREDDPLPGITSASMACWADADADGRLDVFLAGYRDGRNALFRQRDAWRFEAVPLEGDAVGEGTARACAWGDLDGDHLPELVVANARRPAVLLRNRGGMRLVSDTASPVRASDDYGYGLSFADVNGDGLRDLFVANFDADNALYLGRPGGDLEAAPLGEMLQSAATKGHVWGDFDLDGHLDAYLGSGTPAADQHNRLWLAEGGGRFRDTSAGEATAHADTSAAVAAADHDRDGDLDLFVANWGGPSAADRLYLGTAAASDRGSLAVALEGAGPNRMALGARVSVLADPGTGPRWMHRWLDATTGYAGQNEPVLHFGLGTATVADSVVVTWPSGRIDRRGAVAASTRLTVREGGR